MTQYLARILDGLVAEIIQLPDDVAVSDAFHPDVVATLKPCSEETAQGWTYDGKKFSVPVEPAAAPSFEGLKALVDMLAANRRVEAATGTYQQWVDICAAIDTATAATKAAIDKSKTSDKAWIIATSIDWPTA
jgi:hypothetical protein